MAFSQPAYLFFLTLLAPMIIWYAWRMHNADASLRVSSVRSLRRYALPSWMRHIPFALRVIAVIVLSIALARPQLTNRWQSETTEGIDIMMALDVSGTMLAEDFKPNRLEAAKTLGAEFILDRPNDQIGLVVFAGESFTQCPLTTDHGALVNLMQAVQFGMIDDGTAIGLGLANCVNRMKDSPTKSKVIILLTDGSNNAGDIDPGTAAEIAKTFGIRVYAVGVGSYGEARVPVQTPQGTRYMTMDSQFDENTLKKIANTTGGAYFRATDNSSLKRIYEQIDQLEKTKMRVREYSKRTENFAPYLLAALMLLIVEILVRYFGLRTISN